MDQRYTMNAVIALFFNASYVNLVLYKYTKYWIKDDNIYIDYKGLSYSTVGEEKQFNPRLAGKTKEEFAEIMNNLGLPHPKKIDVSVPANQKCGNLAHVV